MAESEKRVDYCAIAFMDKLVVIVSIIALAVYGIFLAHHNVDSAIANTISGIIGGLGGYSIKSLQTRKSTVEGESGGGGGGGGGSGSGG